MILDELDNLANGQYYKASISMNDDASYNVEFHETTNLNDLLNGYRERLAACKSLAVKHESNAIMKGLLEAKMSILQDIVIDLETALKNEGSA